MDQHDLLKHLVTTLESLELRYGLTGSHASALFGEPRFTMDINVIVELSPDTLQRFCDGFPYPRFYVSEDGARHAAANGGMFNIIESDTGQKVDVIVPAPNARRELDRAIRGLAYADCNANFISAEDLILNKMEFYREGGSEKHLRDIGGMLKVSKVDRPYIRDWSGRLGLEEIWDAILSKLNQPG